jgi:hypothetical protein
MSECEGCDEQECQECCPHDERDHYICLDCGHDGTDEAMSDAYDAYKASRYDD